VVRELRAAGATGEVLVGGHADSRGSAAYNRSLSERRASRVSAALGPLVRGLPVTLRAQGFGDKRPVAPNTLPSGADTRRAARRTAG
jgi:outer membrane protein OmpA-like peptidoglycan-associated protein